MILPSTPWLAWKAVHEAGHATIAQAFGVKVARVTIVADGDIGGRCVLADGKFPSARAALSQLLAGMVAMARCQPDCWEWAFGSGNGEGDVGHAHRLAAQVWGEENRVAAMNAGLETTERLVEEFWPEILAMASRLLEERTIVFDARAA